MSYFQIGVFAMCLGLAGCSQVARQTHTAFNAGSLPRAPLAPSAAAPQAEVETASTWTASLGRIVENDGRPATEDMRTAASARTQALRPKSETFAMKEAASPLTDLANMGDWPRNKTTRFLPPPLILPIISIQEIRLALMAEIERY